ncbi:uncharacterized protein RHIMIDRAFT_241486 [Rhizopus microsporus ATCC 52813]|uniref:Uncharacterized protein n=1 Tax=Rhizopus microsporus ATCC 52813 TaxID=1340429 RepID=A0A2G4SI72_RHIZD|nr:uncharacterized protein RHIMIDRAFT_241486 [Rhizopus microsporus ATCC 52813]PHZ08465.1 hypothetical protein RHIMIDRAFT_241486 [Rhizopus microsporus ATCC 52813]
MSMRLLNLFIDLFRTAHRGNNISNNQSEQLFTREQVEQIIEKTSRKFNLDRTSEGPQTFQTKSWKSWRTAHPSIYRRASKNLLRTFQKFHRELKRKTVGTLQSAKAEYKEADRLMIVGRAATGLYEECQQFLKPGGSDEQFFHIMEDIRQLAVYSYATSKSTKSEARTMAIKALKLPDSVDVFDEIIIIITQV